MSPELLRLFEQLNPTVARLPTLATTLAFVPFTEGEGIIPAIATYMCKRFEPLVATLKDKVERATLYIFESVAVFDNLGSVLIIFMSLRFHEQVVTMLCRVIGNPLISGF